MDADIDDAIEDAGFDDRRQLDELFVKMGEIAERVGLAPDVYILKDRVPVKCSYAEHMRWELEHENDRHVALDAIGEAEVSTVFIGKAKFMMFETMVFGKHRLDNAQWRWKTWEEAEAGHRQICQEVRRSIGFMGGDNRTTRKIAKRCQRFDRQAFKRGFHWMVKHIRRRCKWQQQLYLAKSSFFPPALLPLSMMLKAMKNVHEQMQKNQQPQSDPLPPGGSLGSVHNQN